MRINKKFMSVLLAVMVSSLACQAVAQQKEHYPTKPIRMVVPFLPGGAVDIMARLIGQHLGERFGQPVIVDNRAGAGGTIGADLVAKSAADGHTLLFTAQGPLVMNPFLMKKLPYDAQTAFAPVSVVAEAPNVLAVSPAMPVRTVREFVAYGKQHPDKMTFATQGLGTTGHVTGVMMNQRMGLALIHVPYKGFPSMFTDVVSNRVGMLLTDTFNVVPRVRSKELVAIAVAANKRSSVLPDVPTFAESGYPDVVAGPWFSIVAPAGTPMQIRKRLATEVAEILKLPAVAAKFKDLGSETRGSTPEQFEVFLKAEYKRWGDTIRTGGITIDN
jgi:tripartite-type tricarboxylate transporter receptor subunit TctC